MKRLTTLTGPSCAGKSTLERMLAERGAQRAISTTTRAPRNGEVDGVDYYFVSQDEFATLRECGMLVECAKFGDHWYGLSIAELDRVFAQGDHVVAVCEPVGANRIKEYCASRDDIRLREVFVDNPLDVINDRFLKRFYEDMRKAAMLRQGDPKMITARYAKRLTVMQTTERAWREELHLYDLYLPRFDEFNADLIVLALSNTAH